MKVQKAMKKVVLNHYKRYGPRMTLVELVTALHTSPRSGPSFCAAGRVLCVDTSFTARPKIHVDKENNARFIMTTPHQESVLTLKIEEI